MDRQHTPWIELLSGSRASNLSERVLRAAHRALRLHLDRVPLLCRLALPSDAALAHPVCLLLRKLQADTFPGLRSAGPFVSTPSPLARPRLGGPPGWPPWVAVLWRCSMTYVIVEFFQKPCVQSVAGCSSAYAVSRPPPLISSTHRGLRAGRVHHGALQLSAVTGPCAPAPFWSLARSILSSRRTSILRSAAMETPQPSTPSPPAPVSEETSRNCCT